MAPEINISLDQSEGSLLSDDFLDTPDDLDINVDDIETPDETDSLEFLGNGNELEWEGNGGRCPAQPPLPTLHPHPPFHLASFSLSGHFLTVVPTDEQGPEGPYPQSCRGQRELDVNRRF